MRKAIRKSRLENVLKFVLPTRSPKGVSTGVIAGAVSHKHPFRVTYLNVL